MNNHNTFLFDAVVKFEITAEEAASLLAVQDYGDSVNEWISRHLPVREKDSPYNSNQLRSALGACLASRKVEEARQLTMSCDSQP